MESVKFNSVKVENILKVKFAELDFSSDKVVIGGENGAGKSSVAKAIWMAFAGKKGAPDWPVHNGEQKGKVSISLDNGMLLDATVYPDRTVELSLKDAEGATQKSPLKRLEEFNLEYGFYPQRFLDATPSERATTLREMCGINTVELDAQREKLYNERTIVNREVKTCSSMVESLPRHPEVSQRLDAASVSKELQDAMAFNQRRLVAEQKVSSINSEYETNLAKIAELTKRNEELLAESTKLSVGLEKYPSIDLDPIKEKLNNIEQNNTAFDANKNRADMLAKLNEVQAKSDKLTNDIAAIEREKAKLLSSVKMPLPELSIQGEMVMFKGVPFEQASEAEKWKAAIAIAFALKPKLKLVYVRDGSLLSEKTRQSVYELVKQYGGQLLFEVVGEPSDVDVIMQDGFAKNA